jgi:hypothetical protein
MIRVTNSKTVQVYEENFVQDTLRIFRANKYWFELVGGGNSVSSRNVVHINTNYTQQGAKDLITFIRDLAIYETEVFSQEQKNAIVGTQTLYIVYESFNKISLRHSEEVLTIEEIQEKNPNSNIWVSHNITDEGLILLVNEIIERL